jgi:hypothetical protein
MKRKSPPPSIDIAEVCQACGKPIAAQLKSEALCTSCRYGERAYEDRAQPVVDCVDYMSGGEGDRLTAGFRRINRHRDA